MTVPSGLFTPGGRTGLAKEKAAGVIPIDWLEANVATRRWWAKAERDNVGAAQIIDLAIDLQEGYEGIVQQMVLLGKAGVMGAVGGPTWGLLFNRVPAIEAHWHAALPPPNAGVLGVIDFLHESDGIGNSWGRINIWVPQGTRVEVAIRNTIGTSDNMGWVLWGMYWPLSLREEWMTRGWRGK